MKKSELKKIIRECLNEYDKKDVIKQKGLEFLGGKNYGKGGRALFKSINGRLVPMSGQEQLDYLNKQRGKPTKKPTNKKQFGKKVVKVVDK